MGIKRLSIPLEADQHKAIKLSASLHGQTMKEYILARLFAEDHRVPNKKTLNALREMEQGKNLTTYDNVDDFFKEMKSIHEKYQNHSRKPDEKRSRTHAEKRERS